MLLYIITNADEYYAKYDLVNYVLIIVYIETIVNCFVDKVIFADIVRKMKLTKLYIVLTLIRRKYEKGKSIKICKRY